MTRRKHHFVPRFYLGAFRSAPRRIHLCNLRSGIVVKDASLKDQCYKRGFYGEAEEVEDALALLEDQAASVLREIRACRALPRPGTSEHLALLAFVAMQVLRTTVAASRVDASVDKTLKQVYSRDPRWVGVDFEAIRIGYERPVLGALQSLPWMLDAIGDLSGHLVISTKESFVTSDNPAFRYNQYCEGIEHAGTLGALCKGFEIFVPLAPALYLLLYDTTTYSVKCFARYSGRSVATSSDVVALNTTQFVSADEHIYFSDWRQSEGIKSHLPRMMGHRIADPTVVVEYGQDDDPNSSLLHTFERAPNLNLTLSCLRLRRRASRVPLQARARQHRKSMPMPHSPEPPGLRERAVTFSRFLGRR
jgi:hypothetical protein